MADVRPLKALHYNLAAVPSLADVSAPPYDVIDARARRELLARSPFNVVEIDLPEAPAGATPTSTPPRRSRNGPSQGVLAADREPALWALTQDYTAPDGDRHTRRGLLCPGPGDRLRARAVRPHERTQPGPKEDRLRLTRATRHNLSPIFSLHARRRLAPRRAGSRRRALGRGDRRRRHRPPRLADRRPRGASRGRRGARRHPSC